MPVPLADGVPLLVEEGLLVTLGVPVLLPVPLCVGVTVAVGVAVGVKVAVSVAAVVALSTEEGVEEGRAGAVERALGDPCSDGVGAPLPVTSRDGFADCEGQLETDVEPLPPRLEGEGSTDAPLEREGIEFALPDGESLPARGEGEAVPEMLCTALAVEDEHGANGVLVALPGVPSVDALPCPLPLGDPLALGLRVSDTERLPELETEGEGVGLREGRGEVLNESCSDLAAVAVGGMEGSGEDDTLGLTCCDREATGEPELPPPAEADGLSEGLLSPEREGTTDARE